jgi:hypothetical protein
MMVRRLNYRVSVKECFEGTRGSYSATSSHVDGWISESYCRMVERSESSGEDKGFHSTIHLLKVTNSDQRSVVWEARLRERDNYHEETM